MPKCPRAKLVKRLQEEACVIPLREDREVKLARNALIASLGRYCEARCGGCAVTRAMEERAAIR